MKRRGRVVVVVGRELVKSISLPFALSCLVPWGGRKRKKREATAEEEEQKVLKFPTTLGPVIQTVAPASCLPLRPSGGLVAPTAAQET